MNAIPFHTTTLLLAAASLATAAEIHVACLNNTGDATLINNAISGSSAGDEIVITGTGMINQTIKLIGGRTYRGDGRTTTILKQASGANLTALLAADGWMTNTNYTGTPISLRHLTIDGNKAANTGSTTAGLVLRSWLTTVEDIEVRQTGGDGIRLSNASSGGTLLTTTQVNGRIADCYINDCSGSGIFVSDNGSSGSSCTDWTLLGNEVRNAGGHGIFLDHGAGWYITENKVYDPGKHGIYVSRAFGTSLAGNVVERFGRSTAAGTPTYYGIAATVQGGIGSTIFGNATLMDAAPGNAAATLRHVAIIQVNYGDGYVSVTDNTLTHSIAAGATGLYYAKGSGTSLTAASTGNTVTGAGTARFTGTGVTITTGH